MSLRKITVQCRLETILHTYSTIEHIIVPLSIISPYPTSTVCPYVQYCTHRITGPSICSPSISTVVCLFRRPPKINISGHISGAECSRGCAHHLSFTGPNSHSATAPLPSEGITLYPRYLYLLSLPLPFTHTLHPYRLPVPSKGKVSLGPLLSLLFSPQIMLSRCTCPLSMYFALYKWSLILMLSWAKRLLWFWRGSVADGDWCGLWNGI